MRRPVFALLVVLTLTLLAAAPASANLAPAMALADAVEWLRQQQRSDGGFPGFGDASDPSATADAVSALAAVGIPVESVRSGGQNPLDFLRTHVSDYGSTTGGAAKLALAAIASGADPRSFAGVDLIGRLQAAFDEQSGLYDSSLFVHSYALMAVAAANAGREQRVPQAAIAALLTRQSADGSWAWNGSTEPGAGDSNTTAIVLQALIVAGLPSDHHAVRAGLAFLKTTQLVDGSFVYQPGEPPLAGDANSTALAVQAIIATGGDPGNTEWSDALHALSRFRNPSGALRWRDDVPDDNLLATLQAIPALARRPLPVVPADPRRHAWVAETPGSRGRCLYAPETRHNVCDAFLSFWESNGGLANFGHPLTRPYVDPQLGQVVQYFERARFELHRHADGTTYVLLGRLGAERAAGRDTVPAFKTATPIARSDCRFIRETGHNLCAGFRAYWEAFGGLAVFGYPISEEHLEGGIVVQYFERARFEWHPRRWPERYDVLLGRLGAEIVEAW
jgi:hypothetical protein